jgi:hypothetical protein
MNTTEKAHEICTDGDVVKLITTVRQIVTDLRTAHSEGDRFDLIVGAVYGLVLRK